MKKLKAIIVYVFVLGLLVLSGMTVSAAPESPNLIRNPGFDDTLGSLNNWYEYSTYKPGVVSNEGVNGTNALKMVIDANTATTNLLQYSNAGDFAPSTTYYYEFKVRLANGSGDNLTVDRFLLQFGDGANLATNGKIAVIDPADGNGWYTVKGFLITASTVDGTTVKPSILFQYSKGTNLVGTAYIDNLVIKKQIGSLIIPGTYSNIATDMFPVDFSGKTGTFTNGDAVQTSVSVANGLKMYPSSEVTMVDNKVYFDTQTKDPQETLASKDFYVWYQYGDTFLKSSVCKIVGKNYANKLTGTNGNLNVNMTGWTGGTYSGTLGRNGSGCIALDVSNNTSPLYTSIGSADSSVVRGYFAEVYVKIYNQGVQDNLTIDDVEAYLTATESSKTVLTRFESKGNGWYKISGTIPSATGNSLVLNVGIKSLNKTGRLIVDDAYLFPTTLVNQLFIYNNLSPASKEYSLENLRCVITEGVVSSDNIWSVLVSAKNVSFEVVSGPGKIENDKLICTNIFGETVKLKGYFRGYTSASSQVDVAFTNAGEIQPTFKIGSTGITKLQEGNITCTATIANYSSSNTLSQMVIAAYYQGEKLVSVDTYPINNLAALSQQDAVFNIANVRTPQNGDVIKVFKWNSLSEMKPVVNNYIFNSDGLN